MHVHARIEQRLGHHVGTMGGNGVDHRIRRLQFQYAIRQRHETHRHAMALSTCGKPGVVVGVACGHHHIGYVTHHRA